MKNTEARQILGLSPDDNPRAFMPAFEETREFKQKLVDNAPSEEMKFRYQQELLEYEAAVRVVAGQQKPQKHTDFIVVLLLIAALSAVGWWGYQWYQQQWNKHAQNEVRIAQLQSDGRVAVIGRKWEQAEKAYHQIEEIDPGSPVAAEGFAAIKRGKAEEQSQQLFYTLGECQAALEAGRWDEAEKLAKSVLGIAPDNTSAQRKLEIIREGRHKQEISLKMMTINQALENSDIQAARKALEALGKMDSENPNILVFARRIDEEDAKTRKRYARAMAFFEQASRLDTGEFSPKAMALLNRARRLHPDSQEILALHKKMSAYTRAIVVPADYPTIAKALEAARPRDLIRLSSGTYRETIILDKPVRLEGSSDGKTIIEAPAKQAPVVMLTVSAAGSKVSSLNIRHIGFDHGADRFSGITIHAKDITVQSCTVDHAAGHGIAIVNGASATISDCKMTRCGWDGVSVYGRDSQVKVTDTTCQNNLQHGVGFWMGGSGSVTNSRLINNGLCGIVAMSKGAGVTIKSSTCSRNREAGILISDSVTANLDGNKCEENLLSGIVARGEGTSVSMTNNVTTGNRQVGILTHLGVKTGRFENNKSKRNVNRQIWRDANLKR